jgi:uncharacterized protein YndB with AHSA1/START domain
VHEPAGPRRTPAAPARDNRAFAAAFRMLRRTPLILFALAVGISATSARAATADATDIAVTIDYHGSTVDVVVDMTVDATPEQVFAVLTDYDHMARFVSNVAASRIVGRDGGRLTVEQKSRLAFGPLTYDFSNLREVTPVPFREIRTRVTEGHMKGSAFTTTLRAEGARTRVDNRGHFALDIWLPPVIGPAVLESETRKQFQEFRTEILRRQRGGARKRKTKARR